MPTNSPITFFIDVPNLQGGDKIRLLCSVGADGNLIINSISNSGIADSVNKRFMTDVQQTAVALLASSQGGLPLASVPNVNLNTATEQPLYTVPAGKSCVVLNIGLRNASTSLTTASYSFGFNAGTDNNVVSTATHTQLVDNTLYTILNPKLGAHVGTAGEVLALKNTILQGGAATITVDVFGYLF